MKPLPENCMENVETGQPDASFSNPSPLASIYPSTPWYHQLAALLIIVTELCWVVPWYLLVIQVSKVSSPGLAVLVLSGVISLSYFVTTIIERLNLLRKVQIYIQAGLLLVCLVLSIVVLLENHRWEWIIRLVNLDPGAVLVLFAVLWLWWRGMSLASKTIRPWHAWRSFEIGILGLVAYLLVAGRNANLSTSLFWLALYLFIGTLSIIITRISYVAARRGTQRNPFDRRWFLSIVCASGLVIFVALLLASLITGQWSNLLEISAEIIKSAGIIIVFILSIPSLLLASVIMRLEPLFRRIMYSIKEGFNLTSIPVLLQSQPDSEQGMQIFSKISTILSSMIFWAIIFILVALIIKRTRKYFQRVPSRLVDDTESIVDRKELSHLLKKAFENTKNRFSALFHPIHQRIAAVRIRAIYTQLLALCVKGGAPRPLTKTPIEFLPTMKQLFANCDDSLEIITDAYLLVRYGLIPEATINLLMIEEAWRLVKNEGDRVISQKRGN